MDQLTIIMIFLVISIIIAIAIGANDETMSPIYGARILNLKQILILALIFAILGAIVLGQGVAESVGQEILLIDYEYNLSLDNSSLQVAEVFDDCC